MSSISIAGSSTTLCVKGCHNITATTTNTAVVRDGAGITPPTPLFTMTTAAAAAVRTTTDRQTIAADPATMAGLPFHHDGRASTISSSSSSSSWSRRAAWQPPVRSLWLVLAMLQVVKTRGAVAGLLSMGCSSVCSHGTCRYPSSLANKAVLTCDCYPGWGGEQCSIPCSRACGQGQCVFVRDEQVCLCRLGFVGPDCNTPGYDVVTLLSLARLIHTGPPHLFAPPPPPPLRRQPPSPPPLPVQHAQGKGGDAYQPASSSTSSSSPPARAPEVPSLEGKISKILARSPPHGAPSSSSSSSSSPPPPLPPDPDQKAGVSWAGESGLGPGGARREQSVGEGGGGPLVDNPREHVERNVELGSSQCMQNFVCQNGGRCVTGTFGGFRCRCKPPYFGTFCENSCPTPCQNGGRCLKLRQAGEGEGEGVTPASSLALSVSGYRYVYRCVCPPLFTGQRCEKKTAT